MTLLDELDLTDILEHPSKSKRLHIFLKYTRNILQDDHMLGYMGGRGKFKKSEIISSIYSDHDNLRLEINYMKKKTLRNTNIWRLNSMLLKNHWITEEIKEETKKNN